MGKLGGLEIEPGRREPLAALEPGKVFGVLGEDPADLVEAEKQEAPMLPVDAEGYFLAVRQRDRPGREIDRQWAAGGGRGHDPVDPRLLERNRQQPVLEAVGVKNLAEARGDDAADAEIEERPDGVLAAGSGAEVASGDQDRRVIEGRRVEDERCPVRGGLEAAFVEEVPAEAGLVHEQEEA